jgi:hypothetical protein
MSISQSMQSNSVDFVPNTSAGKVSNSGARAFSGQQAQIYKINFNRLQNSVDYSNYLNHRWDTPPQPVPSDPSWTPTQNNPNLPYIHLRYNPDCTPNDYENNNYYTYKKFVNYC